MRRLIVSCAALLMLAAYQPATASGTHPGAPPTATFGGGDESIGSLPTPLGQLQTPRNATIGWGEAGFTERKEKVEPGKDYCAPSGVCVENDTASTGNAYVTKGTAATEITTKSGFEGSIYNLATGQSVDLGSNQDVDISGTGGTVEIGGGSEVDVTADAGGSGITVTLQGGQVVTVAAGSSAHFST